MPPLSRPHTFLVGSTILVSTLWLAEACTNLIVTPGASEDGSAVFSYTADAGKLYGTLNHLPAAHPPAGSKRKVWNWDTGVYLGEIDEANQTFNVIGNLNEHGLAIGETTWAGLTQLHNGAGLLDYGSLIWVTLQRAKTPREAIQMFASLTDQYGYVSTGESFTIGNSTEIWIMELIGKGKFEKGAVWVAVRIPDGHVSGHANQARIQRFDWNDPENCMYSHDVLSFAAKQGLWDASRPKEDFSWADTYDPISFTGARQDDGRVWSFFRDVAEDAGFGKAYESYVLGRNVSAEARMPLSIKPKAKISALDLMGHMRNHYEGSVLDPRHDVGAGSSGSPFRTRPITWKHGDKTYVHERFIGTPQAAWNFVAQLRGWLPPAIGGLLWFAPDDATFSVHAPFHAGTTAVPKSYADGTGDALTWSTESAFWAFNSVANFVYPRWYAAREVIESAAAAELAHKVQLAAEERRAMELYQDDPAALAAYLTKADIERADEIVKTEWALFGQLMVKYRDGFRISSLGPHAPDHGGAQGGIMPKVEEIGYSDEWLGRIVQDAGEHYELLGGSEGRPDLLRSKLAAMDKGAADGVWQPESPRLQAAGASPEASLIV